MLLSIMIVGSTFVVDMDVYNRCRGCSQSVGCIIEPDHLRTIDLLLVIRREMMKWWVGTFDTIIVG